MMALILAYIKKLINWPNIDDHLTKLEKKITVYFTVTLAVITIGTVCILGELEQGFHWAYLFKV